MRPQVGLGVLIFRNRDELLLHKRKGNHCAGHWSSPGGHLEYKESFEDCARREIHEECGPDLKIHDLRYFTTVNTIYPEENKHYVTIFMMALHTSGEAKVMEPDKCEVWQWFRWCRLPSPLMLGNLLVSEQFPYLVY